MALFAYVKILDGETEEVIFHIKNTKAHTALSKAMNFINKKDNKTTTSKLLKKLDDDIIESAYWLGTKFGFKDDRKR